jgi:hypothetical protein
MDVSTDDFNPMMDPDADDGASSDDDADESSEGVPRWLPTSFSEITRCFAKRLI